MSFAERLLRHASDIIPDLQNGDITDDVCLRRAVSASYYALFHLINEDAVRILAPNVTTETSYRIQRWFEHAKMKEICGRFLKEKLEQPLSGLIGDSASAHLQTVCRNFITLQDARHAADYDQGYAIDRTEALKHFASAVYAVAAWNRIKETGEANIFILSLLLWKNWEKDR